MQRPVSVSADGHEIRLENVTGADREDEHVFVVRQAGRDRIVGVYRPGAPHEAQPGDPAFAEMFRPGNEGTTLDGARTIRWSVQSARPPRSRRPDRKTVTAAPRAVGEAPGRAVWNEPEGRRPPVERRRAAGRQSSA